MDIKIRVKNFIKSSELSKKNELIFIPIGGSEEIGMNANLYHYNDKWILIDLGISFPDETNLGVDVILPRQSMVLLLF